MISILLGVLKWSCIFCMSLLIIIVMVSITGGILYKISEWLMGWKNEH